jgi:AcrR family transcriptional regulator
MARRAAGKAPPKPEASAKDRLVDAALSLAARQGWRGTGLAEIAAEAGLSLVETYDAAPSKLALLAAFHRRIDRAALAETGDPAAPARDRLFDVLMRRFDALAPHRAALRSILRDSRGDPGALLGAAALVHSMGWMLEAAGVSAAGLYGGFRAHLLSGIYLLVLRVFLDDDSTDLAKTMAALDRRLRRSETLLGLGDRREAPAAA